MKILKRVLLIGSFLWTGLVVFVFVMDSKAPFGTPPANPDNPAAILREHVSAIVNEHPRVFSIESGLSDMAYLAQYFAQKKRFCDNPTPSKGTPSYAEVFICGEPVDGYSFNIRKSYEELLEAPTLATSSGALEWYLQGIMKLLSVIFLPIGGLILACESGIRILRRWEQRDTLI